MTGVMRSGEFSMPVEIGFFFSPVGLERVGSRPSSRALMSWRKALFVSVYNIMGLAPFPRKWSQENGY